MQIAAHRLGQILRHCHPPALFRPSLASLLLLDQLDQVSSPPTAVADNADFRDRATHDVHRVDDRRGSARRGSLEETVFVHVVVGRPELGPECQHHVGGLDELPRVAKARPTSTPPSGCSGRQDAAAIGGHRQQAHRACSASARISCAAQVGATAGEDDRRLGAR